MLNDIILNDNGYFLGTIICVYNDKCSRLENKEYELIDGQQRFTTLSILLLAIYSYLTQYKSIIEVERDMQRDYLNLESVFTYNKESRLKLQKQDCNSVDYNYLLSEEGLIENKDKPKYYGKRRIYKVYKFYKDKIREYIDEVIEEDNDQTDKNKCKIIFNLLKKVNTAIIVMITVNSNSDAYVLFDALNNSGKPLSAVDLIKNILISMSSKDNKDEQTYEIWVEILKKLSDDYSIQERFFRQYYNSFRDEINEPFKCRIADKKVGKKTNYYFGSIATKTTLLSIYDRIIKEDYDKCLMSLRDAANTYSILMNMNEDNDEFKSLTDKLIELERVQAAAAYILLLNLFRYKNQYKIDNEILNDIIDYTIKFFIRRNLTDYPNTRKLATIFMNIVTNIYIQGLKGKDIVSYIVKILKEESSTDSEFEKALRGDVYQNNPEATRFLLCYYEQEHFTRERKPDLWEKKEGKNYIWTIEHIFPEGEKIPQVWVDMIGEGNKEAANEILEKCVHTLGNLTITGYNSSLSNKGFEEKKERKDKNGNKIGYNSGLYINEEIYKKNEWKEKDIVERTGKLVKHFLNKYSL